MLASSYSGAANALRDSASLIPKSALLRQRLDEDGYVYLPGFLPPAVLAPLRDEFTEIARAAGWLQAGTPPEHAFANPSAVCGGPDLSFWRVNCKMFVRERFHRFPHNPLFKALFARLFDGQPLLHPQLRMHLRFPNYGTITPAHQDYFDHHGSPETFTVWIPLTDCLAEMGGLQLLPQSNRLGLLPARFDDGVFTMISPLPDDWSSADYRFGDVVIFHSLTVHRALPNLSDRLRMSINFRYQKLSAPIVAERFLPPLELTSWESVYRGWESDELTYYWRSLDLNCSPSIATLRRIASLPDHPQASVAADLLLHLCTIVELGER